MSQGEYLIEARSEHCVPALVLKGASSPGLVVNAPTMSTPGEDQNLTELRLSVPAPGQRYVLEVRPSPNEPKWCRYTVSAKREGPPDGSDSTVDDGRRAR